MNGISDHTRRLSGCSLKVIAVICMLIDHIGAVLLESWMRQPDSAAQYQLLRQADLVLRGIGRLAFPLFCFLLVEGFHYTHSRLKYGRNLLLFALLSEIPFDLAFSHCLYNPASQNVFFTLLIGLLTLCCIEWLTGHPREHLAYILLFYPSVPLFCGVTARALNRTVGIFGHLPEHSVWIAAALAAAVLFLCSASWTPARKYTFTMTVLPMVMGILLADLLKTDYKGLGVLAITVMWSFRKNPETSVGAGAVCLSAGNLYELPSLLDLILLSFYNGKRGHQLKYLFYLFYPVHLTVLALLNFQLGFAAFSVR